MIETNSEDSDCLVIRTDLIKALLRHQKCDDSMLESNRVSDDVRESGKSSLNAFKAISEAAQRPFHDAPCVSSGGLIEEFVRGCPPLGVSAWAMEECLRVSPKAETWCGSALHPKVWGFPGTTHCPFMTQSSDFLTFLLNE
ncbi:unnamed protein product [Phytomonas sp. EM1]|nr:unnamed protein product [Phytomonas sp. EM1]|eukprot:CCW59668.1 unnamed protein product [Phytomonas sp. isolate EM1]